MRVRLLVAFLLLWTPTLLQACGNQGSLPDELIRRDWNNFVNQWPACSEFVALRELKILGKSIQGNTAEVILQVRGDWIGSSDPVWYQGPCTGFRMEKGFSQTVERKLIYKKYDTGWRLDTGLE